MLRLRDWTPDAHYIGPVQTRGAYGAVTPTSARESGDGLASKQGAGEGGGGVFERNRGQCSVEPGRDFFQRMAPHDKRHTYL